MRWFPRHTQMFRAVASRRAMLPPTAASLLLAIVMSGCSSVSRLNSSLDSAWKAHAQSFPPVPAFDETSPVPATSPSTVPPTSLTAAEPAPTLTPPTAVKPPTAVTPPTAVKPPAVASTPGTSAATPPAATAPPFAWNNIELSAGMRPFQMYQAGQDGFRSFVVGSVGGHDPLAIELVDQLAQHLHENRIILGGFETSIVRTLNPDGEASRSLLNGRGVYVNHQFPRNLSAQDTARNETPEVKFVLQQIRQRQPRRVIHVRSVRGSQGVVASGPTAQDAAGEVAGWLNFRLITLPGNSVDGSLERCLAESGQPQVITFGIPDTANPDDLWANYGDSLLNLLLADNLATRDIARRNHDKTSADLRNRDPRKSSSPTPAAP